MNDPNGLIGAVGGLAVGSALNCLVMRWWLRRPTRNERIASITSATACFTQADAGKPMKVCR